MQEQVMDILGQERSRPLWAQLVKEQGVEEGHILLAICYEI